MMTMMMMMMMLIITAIRKLVIVVLHRTAALRKRAHSGAPTLKKKSNHVGFVSADDKFVLRVHDAEVGCSAGGAIGWKSQEKGLSLFAGIYGISNTQCGRKGSERASVNSSNLSLHYQLASSRCPRWHQMCKKTSRNTVQNNCEKSMTA
jgi:hypothetical protein